MLTLSVRQPWAWLLVQVGPDWKDIENREWRTNYRGPLQIHAARARDPREFRRVYRFCSEMELREAARAIRTFLTDLEHGRWPDIGYGGIVGAGELVDVIDCRSAADWLKPRARSRWLAGHRYGWCLDDRRPLPFRPCRGMPGLFDVDYAALPALEGRGREQGGLCDA